MDFMFQFLLQHLYILIITTGKDIIQLFYKGLWITGTFLHKGWPGSLHDTHVFSNSPIYRMGNDGSLFPKSVLPINSRNILVVILGDLAYPLLMKPFPHGTTDSCQRNFNFVITQV